MAKRTNQLICLAFPKLKLAHTQSLCRATDMPVRCQDVGRLPTGYSTACTLLQYTYPRYWRTNEYRTVRSTEYVYRTKSAAFCQSFQSSTKTASLACGMHQHYRSSLYTYILITYLEGLQERGPGPSDGRRTCKRGERGENKVGRRVAMSSENTILILIGLDTSGPHSTNRTDQIRPYSTHRTDQIPHILV